MDFSRLLWTLSTNHCIPSSDGPSGAVVVSSMAVLIIGNQVNVCKLGVTVADDRHEPRGGAASRF
jgi:hypothetical protein